MKLFGRTRSGPPVTGRPKPRQEYEQTRRHLEAFIRSHRGVEAFLEPRTSVTPPTVLLVAATGEWTRRRVSDPSLVRGLAENFAVPVYDVHLVGYPQRMRDWNERMRRAGRPDQGQASNG